MCEYKLDVSYPTNMLELGESLAKRQGSLTSWTFPGQVSGDGG